MKYINFIMFYYASAVAALRTHRVRAAAQPPEVDSRREPPAAAGVRRRASAVATLRTHRVRAAAQQT